MSFKEKNLEEFVKYVPVDREALYAREGFQFEGNFGLNGQYALPLKLSEEAMDKLNDGIALDLRIVEEVPSKENFGSMFLKQSNWINGGKDVYQRSHEGNPEVDLSKGDIDIIQYNDGKLIVPRIGSRKLLGSLQDKDRLLVKTGKNIVMYTPVSDLERSVKNSLPGKHLFDFNKK